MARPDNRHRPPGPKGGADGTPPGRRPPPPPATGLEARYLQERMDAKDSLTLHMNDGKTVSGVIEGFDRDLITLGWSGGTIIVRKADVRYLHEGDGG